MEEFLRYVLGKLVNYPDELVISHGHIDDGKEVFHVAARESDIPLLVGKGGHTIQAVRNLLYAAARKQGIRVSLEIVEPKK